MVSARPNVLTTPRIVWVVVWFSSLSTAMEFFPEQSWTDVVNSAAMAGQTAANRPCCVFLSPSRRDCFFRSRAQTLCQMTKVEGGKASWTILGGQSNSHIGCLSWDRSHILVYQLALNRTVMALTYNDGQWSDWETLPSGRMSDIPSCAVVEHKVIQCMGRNARNAPTALKQVNGVWRWRKAPFVRLKSTPACVLMTSQEMHCFAVGPSNEMEHTFWIQKLGWMPWESLGGQCSGTPCALVTGINEIKLFSNSSYGRLSSKRWDGISWSGWYIFDLTDPVLKTDVDCVTSTGGRIDCFAGLMPDGILHRASWMNNQWSRWKSYSYIVYDKPVCRFDMKSRIWCFLYTAPPKWTILAFNLIRIPTIADIDSGRLDIAKRRFM